MSEPIDEGSPRAESAACRLATLWSDERCDFELHFDMDWFGDEPGAWRLTLTWTDEQSYLHGADFVTFTWQFYGDTADDAVRYAVQWCEGLLPFERCSACDGDGAYWRGSRRRDQVPCEECGGSGLARSDGRPS